MRQAPSQTSPTAGEGETLSQKPNPLGAYGASIFAPSALMLNAFGLHSRTPAHGEVEVRGHWAKLFLWNWGDRRPCVTHTAIISHISYVTCMLYQSREWVTPTDPWPRWSTSLLTHDPWVTINYFLCDRHINRIHGSPSPILIFVHISLHLQMAVLEWHL